MILSMLAIVSLFIASQEPVEPATPVEPEQDGAPSAAFNYSFLDGGWTFGDLSGLRVAGSYQLQGPWLAVGRFELLSRDEGVVELDLTSFSGGVGYVYPYQEGLDLVATAELEYGSAKASVLGFSASDSEFGIRLRGGARFALRPDIELFGGASIRTIFDSNFSLDVGARYEINDEFSALAGLEFGDETLFNIGVRYSF